MRAALWVEALKLRRSPVGAIAAIAIVCGTVAILIGIVVAVRSGNEQVIAKVGEVVEPTWAGLLAGSNQVLAAGGLLGCGVVLAWMFAREFGEGTIAGLFALPVSRGRIAAAKFGVFAAWGAGVSLALTLGVLAAGLGLGFGMPDAAALRGLSRLLALGLLTMLAAAPVAWCASLSRSLLAGVGCAVALVVLAQVGALAGAGGWMPLAAPAIWAMSGPVGPAQLGLSVAVGLVFGGLTVLAWQRLRLNR